MKKNRYKNKSEETKKKNFVSKPVIILLILGLSSLLLIYVYDFTMQSTYFNLKKINVNGNVRVTANEVIDVAGIKKNDNILSLNLAILKKKILNHPWIQRISIKRSLPSELTINIYEEIPFAIVKIGNLAEIIINEEGKPFKEYEPETDNLKGLPVITGIELTKLKEDYIFNGSLFSSAIKILESDRFGKIQNIKADANTGIEIDTLYSGSRIHMKLGFYDFNTKAYKAEQITNYFKNNFSDKEICTLDLFNPENVLVKSKDKDALHNLTKGGV